MKRRIIAMAAAFAVASLAGAHSAMAGQCEATCDKSFQTCNGSNPDTSACLPKWGQCKRACSPPKTNPVAKTTTTTAAKVTKVASTTTTKPKPKN